MPITKEFAVLGLVILGCLGVAWMVILLYDSMSMKKKKHKGKDGNAHES